MKPSAELLAKAKQAKPPLDNYRWAGLMEPVALLMGNGFTLCAAIDWLVEEKQIPKASKRTAYYSVARRIKRRATKQ